MGSPPAVSWTEANERYLLAALDVVRVALENRAARGEYGKLKKTLNPAEVEGWDPRRS